MTETIIKDGFIIKCLKGMKITRIKKFSKGIEIYTNSTTDIYMENSYKINIKDGKFEPKSPFFDIKSITIK